MGVLFLGASTVIKCPSISGKMLFFIDYFLFIVIVLWFSYGYRCYEAGRSRKLTYKR